MCNGSMPYPLVSGCFLGRTNSDLDVCKRSVLHLDNLPSIMFLDSFV